MIKYRHRNCIRLFTPATFAYDLPPSSYFEELFSLGEKYISFPFGVTLVHPKEQNYNKSVGRSYALRNMKMTTFQVNSIKVENNRQIFSLSTTHSNKEVILQVSMSLHMGLNSRLDWIDFQDTLDYFNE